MSLVRWLRKNNMKLMAVVVIALMFIFVAGDFIQRGTGQTAKQVVGYIGTRKITNYDLYVARGELELLRSLRADDLLRAQDLQGVFLAELLFSDQRGSPALINGVKSAIRRNLYAISDKQINDIYRRQAPPDVLWFCLKNEARRAGIGIPNNQAGELLGQAIPQLFGGRTYSQFMTELMARQGIPEQQILATLGELLAVWQYAQMICVNEGLTRQQVMVEAAAERETIDAQLVEFEAETFAATEEAPSREQMQQHFDKYKTFVAGAISEENPYGFGCKLPARASLEYIAVKLDDVRTIITPPTQDEVGDYYSRNKEELFSEQVRSDPNDPNSELVTRTRSFAEVAGTISKRLLSEKISVKAEGILQEARTLTEAGQAEAAAATAEQPGAKPGDYEAAAKKLSEKYKIKVYAGRTGLLSSAQMQMDEHLGMLFLRGYGQNPVRLTQVVFAVDELGTSELGPFDVPKPQINENIGPVKDLMTAAAGTSRRIVAVVRVIEAHKAAEPESLDVTFSTRGLQLDPNEQASNEDTYSVKEKVAEDLKKLAAMDTAKARAEEFVALAGKEGWDKALSTFEERYGAKDPNKPKIFRLQNLTGLRRMSLATLEALAIQGQGDPSAAFFLNESRKNRLFVDKLYDLASADANTAQALPVVMELKPEMRYLAVKSISVNRLWKEDFEQAKPMQLAGEEYGQAQSLAVIHFNPDRIVKRMRFTWTETGTDAQTTDANTPAESEAAS